MLWKGRRESGNVIDQRSFGAGKMGAGALIFGAFIYYLMGGNPLTYVAQNVGPFSRANPQPTRPATMIEKVLPPSSWQIPKMCGPRSSKRSRKSTSRQRWSSSEIRFDPRAVRQAPRWVRSIAPLISACT